MSFQKIILLSIILNCSACVGSKVIDVKSPCVSNDDGPCGPRRSVNDWWLKKDGVKI